MESFGDSSGATSGSVFEAPVHRAVDVHGIVYPFVRVHDMTPFEVICFSRYRKLFRMGSLECPNRKTLDAMIFLEQFERGLGFDAPGEMI